jgi:hypothetical protein
MQLDLSQVMCYTINALGHERGDLRAKFATAIGFFKHLAAGEITVAGLTGGGRLYIQEKVRVSVPVFL